MASAPDRDDGHSNSDCDCNSDSLSVSVSELDYDLSLEDEQLLASLADRAQAQHHPRPHAHANTPIAPALATQALGALRTTGKRHHVGSTAHRSPGGKSSLVGVARTNSVDAFVRRTNPQSLPSVVPADDVQYPDLSRALTSLEEELETSAQPGTLAEKPSPPPPPPPPKDDPQSPLLRFRTFPKKPLSVSDLTAGAWCELQYEYTLTRLPGGKKTQTTAMKEGSKVHQKLEDEVHTTVQVEIATKEDAFGLKVWNIIQGLRTLRDTGLTRELEVWGLVDGNVVNGLIDFLSHENPSPEFEEEWLSSQGSQPGTACGDDSQKKMTDFFPSDRPEEARSRCTRKVYLTDVKTRGAKTVPKGAAIRPTKVQLFLYHRFLSDMADDKIDFLHVFRRYDLDVDKQFSDAFLAQIGELHDDVFHDTSSVPSTSSASSQDTDTHDLLRYRTLQELVPLLRSELKLTFPAGAESIGSVVTVEYRLRGEEGTLIGTNILAVDTEVLNQYLEGYMEWWRGERSAVGVEVEEAYKCSYCEFAEICTWREDMDRTNLKRVREKLLARAGAADELDDTPRKRGKSPRASRRRKSMPPASQA